MVASFAVHTDHFSECDSHAFNRLDPHRDKQLQRELQKRWNADPNWQKFHRIFAVYISLFDSYSRRALLKTERTSFAIFD